MKNLLKIAFGVFALSACQTPASENRITPAVTQTAVSVSSLESEPVTLADLQERYGDDFQVAPAGYQPLASVDYLSLHVYESPAFKLEAYDVANPAEAEELAYEAFVGQLPEVDRPKLESASKIKSKDAPPCSGAKGNCVHFENWDAYLIFL